MGYERNDRRPGGYSGERGGYGGGDRWQGQGREGSYGSYGGAGGRDYRGDRFNDDGRRDYGRDPRGDENDRGFFERAGDEVRSWFGDEEAERRRRDDERREQAQNRYGDDYSRGAGGDYGNRSYGSGDYGARTSGAGDYGSRSSSGGDYANRGYGDRSYGGTGSQSSYGQAYGGRSSSGSGYGGQGREQQGHDQHAGYRSWRDRQMESFDRDYDDYRRENQSRFDQEFHSWRQTRQGQRDLVGKVKEHQDVVGSDGQHVGTVDHVQGDQLKLTKSDEAAGGHHHYVPAAWIQSVDDKVTLNKTAAQAKQQWQDADRGGGTGTGLFGRNEGDRQSGGSTFDRAFGDTHKS